MSQSPCSVVRHPKSMRFLRYLMYIALGIIVLTTLGRSTGRLIAVGNQAVYLPTVMTPAPAPRCGTPTEVSGDITSATTWDPAQLYVVSDNVTVKAGATLTILPGTVVKFHGRRGIIVEGKLTGVGTTLNPVFLTSWNDDRTCGDTNGDGSASSPGPGDWSGIDFRQASDPSSSIRWANIRYGGRWGNTWLAPIRIFNVTPTFEYLTIQNSFRNAVQLVGGDWTTQTLASTTVIYWINQGESGNLRVLRENTLTIQPGVRIKASYGHGIYVEGTLRADGVITNPIHFSSEKDDTLCGRGVSGESICDTNDDATASAPAAGDWKWIEFSPGSSADSAIQNAVLRYGGRQGGAWRAPIRLDKVSPTLENLTIEHSHRNAAQLIGGGWTTQTLRSTTVVYWLYDDHLNVLADNTLKIMPGVKVKLQDDHAIHIGGKLDAEGTPTQPIVVTSFRDDTVCGRGVNGEPICDTNDDGTASVPGAGNWAWIGFLPGSDPSSVMRYMVLRYGGRQGGAWRAPIRLDKVSPTLENLTIEHSHRNAAQLIGGGWTTQTLRSKTVVYWIYDDHLYVLAANTMTILPGVKIKFYEGHGLIVLGKLLAEGTPAEPLVFTSERDDTVCGRGVNEEPICDTNNDAAASVPGWGNWLWIEFRSESDSASMLRNAVVRYGGRNRGDWRAALMIVNASPTIDKVLLDTNHGGIYFYENAAPSLGCNDLVGNQYGLYNTNPAHVVKAESQWWGHPSGPTHPGNPGGTGQTASDGIDYTPWRNTRCTDFLP